MGADYCADEVTAGRLATSTLSAFAAAANFLPASNEALSAHSFSPMTTKVSALRCALTSVAEAAAARSCAGVVAQLVAGAAFAGPAAAPRKAALTATAIGAAIRKPSEHGVSPAVRGG